MQRALVVGHRNNKMKEMIKVHEEILGDYGQAHYLDYDDGFIATYTSIFNKLYTLQYSFCILLYFIKLLYFIFVS